MATPRTIFLVSLLGGTNWIPSWHRTATSRVPSRNKLGLHYLHSTLEARGYRCRIFDQSIYSFNLSSLVSLCRRAEPLAVGFYTEFSNRDEVGRALEALREQCPNLFLICGGPGYFEDEFYLARGCHAMVVGEGEETLPELLDALERGRQLAEIQGVVYLDQAGEVVRTPPRPQIADLDSLPFPYLTPELTMVEANQSLIGYGRQMEVMTSRGCPFRCSYCATPRIWGRTVRQRSVNNVMAEIDQAVARCGVEFVRFIDDVFAWDADWLDEFVEAMARRPALRFRCILHPLSFRKDPERDIRRLAEVGLVSFFVGLQTLEPSARKLLRRSAVEAEAVIPLLAAARRHGVTTEIQYILALPGDTVETYERILEYSVRARPNMIGAGPLLVLPGAELASRPASELHCSLDEREIERAARRMLTRFNRHPRVLADNLRLLLGRASRISWGAALRRLAAWFSVNSALPRYPADESDYCRSL